MIAAQVHNKGMSAPSGQAGRRENVPGVVHVCGAMQRGGVGARAAIVQVRVCIVHVQKSIFADNCRVLIQCCYLFHLFHFAHAIYTLTPSSWSRFLIQTNRE